MLWNCGVNRLLSANFPRNKTVLDKVCAVTAEMVWLLKYGSPVLEKNNTIKLPDSTVLEKNSLIKLPDSTIFEKNSAVK